MSLFEEYLLILVRICHDFYNYHLSFLFKVSQAHISRILITWINLLYRCFRHLLNWPMQDIVRTDLPDMFRKSFPRTRVIIDATKLHIQKPFRPRAQQITWSNYKHTNKTHSGCSWKLCLLEQLHSCQSYTVDL